MTIGRRSNVGSGWRRREARDAIGWTWETRLETSISWTRRSGASRLGSGGFTIGVLCTLLGDWCGGVGAGGAVRTHCILLVTRKTQVQTILLGRSPAIDTHSIVTILK